MSNKPVVYLLVSLEEDLIDRIAETCEVRMIAPGSSMEEIRSRIGEAEGIVTSPRYGADEAFFAAAPKLNGPLKSKRVVRSDTVSRISSSSEDNTEFD